MFVNKNILITGGTGSWGSELTEQLLRLGAAEIRLFARNESHQVDVARKFADDRVVSLVGDVRDRQAITAACHGVDVAFHLAALKHITICERQPLEAIKTNIGGTINLIDAILSTGVERAVLVSTDKAVSPHNLYGMTKGIAEHLFTNANALGDTSFVCIRSGNVLGSSGSVVPLWIDQIKQHNEVTITDPSMTRFYLTLEEAIHLIFEAVRGAAGGEIFVMDMPACRLSDLADALIDHYGDGGTGRLVTGIRPGEKKHELLISPEEVANAYEWRKGYYVIVPVGSSKQLVDSYKHFPKVKFEQFGSDSKLMSKEEILAMLTSGGFLK